VGPERWESGRAKNTRDGLPMFAYISGAGEKGEEGAVLKGERDVLKRERTKKFECKTSGTRIR